MNNSIAVVNNEVSLVQIRMDKKRYPRLETYRKDIAVQEMIKIIYAVLIYQERTKEPEDIKRIAGNAIDGLLADLADAGTRQISFEEIKIALLKRASIEDFFLSGATINQTIVQYCKTDGNKARKDAENEIKKIQQARLESSGLPVMQDRYSGELVKNNKINRR